MDETMFGQYLQYGVFLCLAMGVLSPLMRWKKFGTAALPLGLAFWAMAVLLYGLSAGWPTAGIAASGAALVLLLAADAFFRSSTGPKK